MKNSVVGMLEEIMNTVDLYHGTTRKSADKLLTDGWVPGSGMKSGNSGQSKYLYLTTTPDNAAWFSGNIGGSVVLKVHVPVSSLKVDPEDGISDTVEEELHLKGGLPGCLVAIAPLEAGAFSEEKIDDSGLFNVDDDTEF